MGNCSVIVYQILRDNLLFIVVSCGSVELFLGIRSHWRQDARHHFYRIFNHLELFIQHPQTRRQEYYP